MIASNVVSHVKQDLCMWEDFLIKHFRDLSLRSFLIGRLIFIGQKFLRKKKRWDSYAQFVICAKRRHRPVFWKRKARCALPTPVYHTYFYTKYFNNATCKSRSSPLGRAADRSYPTYESSSLVIIFSFLTIGSSVVTAIIELYTNCTLWTSQPLTEHF